MPADPGLRREDLQSVQHARCQPIQPGKHQTVDAAEGQSLRRFTSQHVELMTKRHDLYLQRRSRPEQSDQRQPNQAANISHQPRASPDSTALTSRIEFPTMTTVIRMSCGPRGCWHATRAITDRPLGTNVSQSWFRTRCAGPSARKKRNGTGFSTL